MSSASWAAAAEGDHAGLDDRLGLDQLLEIGAPQLQVQADPAGQGGDVGLGHPGAPLHPPLDADQAVGLEEAQGPPHGGSGDVVLLEQGPLGREPVTGS